MNNNLKSMTYLFPIIGSSLLLIFVLTTVSCNRLPANPKKISITLFEGGGMLPDYTRVYISLDSCKYEKNYFDRTVGGHKKSTQLYSITAEELKELYETFQSQGFANIIEHKQKNVHDRGGTSVNLQVDGKFYQKSDAGLSFIRGVAATRFNAVVQAIYKLNAAKTKITE